MRKRSWGWMLSALALFGVGGGCQQAPPPRAQPKTIATVNGRAITAAQLEHAFWRDQAVMVLQEILDDRLLRQEARRYGITVNAEDVEEEFQRRRRRYPTREEFAQMLHFTHQSEAQFRKSLERELLQTHIAERAIPCTEAEVAAYYRAHAGEFRTPEKVRVLGMMFKSAENAKAVLTLLRDPAADADFAGLAKELSEDETTKERGGDYGWQPLTTFSAPLQKVIRRLKKGEVSDPIPLGPDYYLLQLAGRRPARQRPLAEVRAEVRKKIIAEKSAAFQAELLPRLRREAQVDILDPRLRLPQIWRGDLPSQPFSF